MNLIKKFLLFSFAALLLASCDKEQDCDGNKTRAFSAANFTRITANSRLHLTIKQGTTFGVIAEGCRRDVDELWARVSSNGGLELDFDKGRKNRGIVQVNITLPDLTALALSGAAEGTISGFSAQTHNLRIILSGASRTLLDGTTKQTQVEISGASKLTAKGSTDRLYGNVSGGSELRAFETAAKEVDISSSGGANAFVHVQEILRADASGASKIIYRGNPQTKEVTTSGGAKVEPE